MHRRPLTCPKPLLRETSFVSATRVMDTQVIRTAPSVRTLALGRRADGPASRQARATLPPDWWRRVGTQALAFRVPGGWGRRGGAGASRKPYVFFRGFVKPKNVNSVACSRACGLSDGGTPCDTRSRSCGASQRRGWCGCSQKARAGRRCGRSPPDTRRSPPAAVHLPAPTTLASPGS